MGNKFLQFARITTLMYTVQTTDFYNWQKGKTHLFNLQCCSVEYIQLCTCLNKEIDDKTKDGM